MATGVGARKAIHAGLSIVAAAVVVAAPAVTAATILAGATLVALSVEVARRVSSVAARAFDRRLGGMLKERERTRLTGATTLALGCTVAALMLPGTPALAGILFAGLADPAAALVGARYGRLRYPGGKSVAGSVTFLGTGFGLGLGLGLDPAAALLAAGMAAAAEAPSPPVDDNLYLPLAGAAAVVAAGWVTGM